MATSQGDEPGDIVAMAALLGHIEQFDEEKEDWSQYVFKIRLKTSWGQGILKIVCKVSCRLEMSCKLRLS